MDHQQIVDSYDFMKNNESLAKEILKLPFRQRHTFFMSILNNFPLSSGKEKAILRNKNPKITFGIFTDHLMSVAGKLKISNVYIENLRYNKEKNRRYKTNVHVNVNEKDKLNFDTFDIVTAILEKIRERNNNI